MKIESIDKLKQGGFGAVIGAIVIVIIGFSWGGWVTAGTAGEMSEEAVVQSHGSICAAQIMLDPNSAEKIKELKAIEAWERRNYIEKGGWDKMPGEDNAKIYVSNACADKMDSLLVN